MASYPLRSSFRDYCTHLDPEINVSCDARACCTSSALLAPQLKIKFHRRNRFDFSSVYQRRPRSPPLHRVLCRIRQDWLALQHLHHFYASVGSDLHLQHHYSLDAGSSREFRIRRMRRCNQPFEEFFFNHTETPEKIDFQFVHPAFQPVASLLERLRSPRRLYFFRRSHRQEVHIVHSVESFVLLANQ